MSNVINWNKSSVKRFFTDTTQCYGEGQYSVYYWLDSEGKIFYVGMGKGYRFCNVSPSSRSKEFMEIYNRGGCEPKVIAYGMSEEEARKYERNLIEKLDELGFTLVNHQFLNPSMYHTPAKMEALRKLHISRRGVKRIRTEVV